MLPAAAWLRSELAKLGSAAGWAHTAGHAVAGGKPGDASGAHGCCWKQVGQRWQTRPCPASNHVTLFIYHLLCTAGSLLPALGCQEPFHFQCLKKKLSNLVHSQPFS